LPEPVGDLRGEVHLLLPVVLPVEGYCFPGGIDQDPAVTALDQMLFNFSTEGCFQVAVDIITELA
jgi:hypothetical protein